MAANRSLACAAESGIKMVKAVAASLKLLCMVFLCLMTRWEQAPTLSRGRAARHLTRASAENTPIARRKVLFFWKSPH
jgi:hypothetical protein